MTRAKAKPRAAAKHQQPIRNVVQLSGVRARYDAAQTTTDNSNHWAAADALSARAALSPHIRRTLRIRARYEIANCPLARGILRKLADFVVGTGPRLQITTPDRDYNRAVEAEFSAWMVAVKFARKLWQMRYSKAMNGEAFAKFFTNYPLRTPVKLDLQTIEADQVADPTIAAETTLNSDGIRFDDFGNPAAYSILRQHPGDTYAISGVLPNEYDIEKAANVLHYFQAERPGQTRGVPEITASLPLFAMRRRFILATLAAAETAADHAAVLKTQQSPSDPADLVPLDAIDIERRQILTLPGGWDITQFKAEHPTSTMEMFDTVLVREIARDVNMPYGIAASDSSSYNFASGKLDLTPWFQTVRIEQEHIEDVAADPTFERWYAEARAIEGYLPPAPGGSRFTPPHKWFWDGQELLDPREAGAKAESLNKGFETVGSIWARKGKDALDELRAEAELFGVDFEEHMANVYRNIYLQNVPQQQGANQQQEGGPDENA